MYHNYGDLYEGIVKVNFQSFTSNIKLIGDAQKCQPSSLSKESKDGQKEKSFVLVLNVSVEKFWRRNIYFLLRNTNFVF